MGAIKQYDKSVKLADSARNRWRIVPEGGVNLSDMMAEEYWGIVSRKFAAGDILEVLSPSNEWFAELLVLSTGPNFAKVRQLSFVEFAQAGKADELAFEIKHRGGAGWSVKRKSDGIVMFEKGETREQAEKWVAEHTALA